MRSAPLPRLLAVLVALATIAVLAGVTGTLGGSAASAASSTAPGAATTGTAATAGVTPSARPRALVKVRTHRTLRVLVAGDSIVQQVDGQYTWRHRLWDAFVRQGVRVDFVGPCANTVGKVRQPSLTPTTRLDRCYTGSRPLNDNGGAFDRQHGGRAGSAFVEHLRWGPAEVRRYRPDVLLVNLGRNDIGRMRHQPGAIAADLDRYLAKVRAADPGLTIVVGQVQASRRSTPAAQQRDDAKVAAVNAGYAEVVSRYHRPSAPAVMSLNNAGMDTRRMTVDGTHPNPAGEKNLLLHEVSALRRLRLLS